MIRYWGVNNSSFFSSPDEVEVVDVSSRMRLSGRMAIRAFLHPRATVREAVEAVKEDLVNLSTYFVVSGINYCSFWAVLRSILNQV